MAEAKVRSCGKQWKGEKRIHDSGRKLRGNRPLGRLIVNKGTISTLILKKYSGMA
jgi:hypothetical protein